MFAAKASSFHLENLTFCGLEVYNVVVGLDPDICTSTHSGDWVFYLPLLLCCKISAVSSVRSS